MNPFVKAIGSQTVHTVKDNHDGSFTIGLGPSDDNRIDEEVAVSGTLAELHEAIRAGDSRDVADFAIAIIRGQIESKATDHGDNIHVGYLSSEAFELWQDGVTIPTFEG